ncbi:MAG: TolC family protein [Alphaproteobacteria bacterium]|nr:TolC family protein [Alphaproteobacteria bacterium]
MKIIYTCVFLAILNIGLAQNDSVRTSTLPKKWTLIDLLDYAYKNNLTLKNSEILAKLAKVNNDQAKKGQLPSANASVQGGLRFGLSQDAITGINENQSSHFQTFGVGVNIPIFNNLALKHNIAISTFNLKAALEDINKVKNDLATLIAAYYLQAISNFENIKIAQVQISQTQQQIDVTAKRVEAGVLPELNLLELQAQLANDTANLIAVKFTYEQALLSIKAALNLQLSAPLELVIPPLDLIQLEPLGDLQPETVYALALANLPEQKAFQYRIEAAKRNIKLNRQSFYPSINSSIGLGSAFSSTAQNYTLVNGLPVGTAIPYFKQIENNFGQNISLSASIPIFNNYQAKRAYNAAKINLENAQNNFELTNQTLHVNIYNAYINAVNALEKYEASKKLVVSSQKAYDFASKRYEVGLLGVFELIQLQNNYLRANIQNLTARFEYIFRIKLLELYKGLGIKF